MRTFQLPEQKEHRVCNKKAPRWRREIYVINSMANVRKIKEENNEILKDYTPKQIHTLIKDFNKYVIEYMLYNRDFVELPYKLGDMWVAVYGKGGGLNVPVSQEIGKEVKYRNSETDGFGIRLFHTNEYKITKSAVYRHMWVFSQSARCVGNRIKEEVEAGRWKEFMVTKNTKYLRGFIQGLRKKESHTTYKKEKFENYDEFYIEQEDDQEEITD